jgi:membrane protease YdiL (CAAX protease family)
MKTLLGERLRLDWKIVSITIVSTLAIIVDHYHTLLGWYPLDGLILYLLIPLIVIVFIFRESPAEFGFRLGDWKAGLAITAIAVALIAPVLWFVNRSDGSMQAYYASILGDRVPFPLRTFVDLIGWEFLFRGWIVFGYGRKFGPEAIWLQAVPFAIAHIGKPEIETISTIFGGFVFGWVAWRTKSFLYPFLIHWFVLTFTVMVTGGFFG